MKKKLRSLNETLLDLIFGVIIYGVVIGILGMITSGGNVYYLLGVVSGIVLSIGLCTHMLYAIDGALDMDPASASSYMRKRALLRSVVIILVAAVMIHIQYIAFLGLILAIMGIKISAHMQRFIHNITKKILE